MSKEEHLNREEQERESICRMRSMIRVPSQVSSPRIHRIRVLWWAKWISFSPQVPGALVRWTVPTLVNTLTTPDRTLSSTYTLVICRTRWWTFPPARSAHCFARPPSVNYDPSFPPCFPPSHLTAAVLDSQPRVDLQFSQ